MSLTVNTNVAALSAQRNLNKNNEALGNSITRLSSGLRINSAKDDAAGLSIATKFAAQARGLSQAIRNSNNAISLVQVAEGGIDTITNILQRLRELAVQAASDDNTTSDRATIKKEADNLTTELTRVATTSEFNTQTLLDGSFNNKLFQIGANADQTLNINIRDIRGTALGGRAEFIASIDDGVAKAVDEGFGAGEIRINGVNVTATAAADDQFSVLTVASAALGGADAVDEELLINGTSVVADMSGTGAQAATNIVDAINAADIDGVTARITGAADDAFVIEATGGTDLVLEEGALTTTTIFELGTSLGITTAAVTNSNGSSSSIAKAAAINTVKSDTTVSAAALKNTVTGFAAIQGVDIESGELFINGVDIGAVDVQDDDSDGALVTAINNKSSETGVIASISSSGALQLSAADGRNISIQADTDTIVEQGAGGLGIVDSGAVPGAVGTVASVNGSIVFRGEIRLNSQETFTLTSATDLVDLDVGLDGLTSQSVAKDAAKFNVNTIKVDSQVNATAAIFTLDAALNDVSDLRSDLGAIQNRIGFTISNLEIANENTVASESRIRDVDFATEVAKFTKNQILVQAGANMLAQANGLPQIALQLLG